MSPASELRLPLRPEFFLQFKVFLWLQTRFQVRFTTAFPEVWQQNAGETRIHNSHDFLGSEDRTSFKSNWKLNLPLDGARFQQTFEESWTSWWGPKILKNKKRLSNAKQRLSNAKQHLFEKSLEQHPWFVNLCPRNTGALGIKWTCLAKTK